MNLNRDKREWSQQLARVIRNDNKRKKREEETHTQIEIKRAATPSTTLQKWIQQPHKNQYKATVAMHAPHRRYYSQLADTSHPFCLSCDFQGLHCRHLRSTLEFPYRGRIPLDNRQGE